MVVICESRSPLPSLIHGTLPLLLHLILLVTEGSMTYVPHWDSLGRVRLVNVTTVVMVIEAPGKTILILENIDILPAGLAQERMV